MTVHHYIIREEKKISINLILKKSTRQLHEFVIFIHLKMRDIIQ